MQAHGARKKRPPRVSEAGKGFAVMANEVNELAKQTAPGTEEIARLIDAILSDASKSVEGIGKTLQVVTREIDGLAPSTDEPAPTSPRGR